MIFLICNKVIKITKICNKKGLVFRALSLLQFYYRLLQSITENNTEYKKGKYLKMRHYCSYYSITKFFLKNSVGSVNCKRTK